MSEEDEKHRKFGYYARGVLEQYHNDDVSEDLVISALEIGLLLYGIKQ